MPRYHFNLHDDGVLTGGEGVDLPDLDAARRIAAEFFGAVITDAGAAFFLGGDWRLEVTDERGLILFAATAFAQQAAASDPQTSELRRATG